jgi:hypothetical protein
MLIRFIGQKRQGFSQVPAGRAAGIMLMPVCRVPLNHFNRNQFGGKFGCRHRIFFGHCFRPNRLTIKAAFRMPYQAFGPANRSCRMVNEASSTQDTWPGARFLITERKTNFAMKNENWGAQKSKGWI